jgi:hypothetical protein
MSFLVFCEFLLNEKSEVKFFMNFIFLSGLFAVNNLLLFATLKTFLLMNLGFIRQNIMTS